MLITKYLSAVTASIDPFASSGSKSARLFLSLLVKEATRRDANPKVVTKVLPRSARSAGSATSASDGGGGAQAAAGKGAAEAAGVQGGVIEITYKDGKKATFQSHGQTVSQLVALVNRHSKALALKEQAA